jgi:hypothetical protein
MIENSEKHTPGPWHVTGSRVDAYSYYLASSTTGLHINQREANARLIAAAPELLASLRDVLAQLDSELLIRNYDSGWSLKQIPLVMALKAAQEVIQKAEGQEPNEDR